MSEYYAGLNGSHLVCAFTEENGIAKETYACGQVTWNFASIAKKLRIPVDTARPELSIEQAWNQAVSAHPDQTTRADVDRVVKACLPPGNVFHRMARATFTHPADPPSVYMMSKAEGKYLARARNELTSMLMRLKSICRVVEPNSKGLSVYGIEIGELLIIACVCIENSFRGVLESNKLQPAQQSFKTTDFVKLLNPLRLSEYSVFFVEFPWLADIAPFKKWDISTPTQSLEWYNRYNEEKHNRENLSYRPRLSDAFDAVSAFFIVLTAQFGTSGVRGFSGPIAESLSINNYPKWADSELYIHPTGNGSWKKKNFIP